MCLVLTLELYREIEHRFLEEPAVGADLIGGYRLVFGAEHGVKDAGVLGCVAAGGMGFAAGQESDAARRQHGSTRPHQERAPRGEQAKRRMQ